MCQWSAAILDSHAGLRPISTGFLLQGTEHLLFASADLDETRLRVGGVMKAHRLGVACGAEMLDARIHHAGFGEVSLSRLRYAAAVSIDPDPLEDFYLVQMPVAGCAHIQINGRTIDSDVDLASVLLALDLIGMVPDLQQSWSRVPEIRPACRKSVINHLLVNCTFNSVQDCIRGS